MEKRRKSGILIHVYRWRHPNVPYDEIPYWYKRSVIGEIWHLIRKGICQNIAPNCVLTPVRIGLYRLCGFKIGKGCFIGMKCYLDDLCVDKQYRGQGIGKKLYGYAIEKAKEFGCYHLTLNVWHLNENAIKFYEKLGMKPLKTTMETIL